MPWSVWPEERYPHYCISYAALFSPGCAEALLDQANQLPFQYLLDFYIDDTLYTGVLRQVFSVCLCIIDFAVCYVFLYRLIYAIREFCEQIPSYFRVHIFTNTKC